MSYYFNPMTDEELDTLNLVDKGIYKFEVIKSNEKRSKSGNVMAELNIKFWDKQNTIHTLFDYLVFSETPLCIRKVKHFCDAVCLQDAYKAGQLPDELRGYKGLFEIGVQDEQPNPNGGVYPKKNIVVDYIKMDNPQQDKGLTGLETDDIPF